MSQLQHRFVCIALSSLFSVTAISVAAQKPVPVTPIAKEKLMTAPADARHYTISSIAGKHGDIWAWSMQNGHMGYRMSMNLRGWITEEDEQVTLGRDGRATAIEVRGYSDSGDATESFHVDPKGIAHWKTVEHSATDVTTATVAPGSNRKETSRR